MIVAGEVDAKIDSMSLTQFPVTEKNMKPICEVGPVSVSAFVQLAVIRSEMMRSMS